MSETVTKTPLTKTVLRVFRNLFWSLLVLLIGLVALVFSGVGNQLIVYGANKLVPNLSISMKDDPLLRGGQFSVNYKNEQLALTLVNAQLDVRFYSCAAICVKQFNAQSVAVELAASKNTQEPDTQSPLGKIELPMSLAVKTFSIKSFRFTQGELALDVTEFFTQLNAQKSELTVERLAVNKIKLALPAQNKETSATKTTSPITMPKISPLHFETPLDWQINALRVSQFELAQADVSQVIRNVSLQAKQQASDLNVIHLSLDYQDISAALNGALSLANHNPISLTATVEHPKHAIKANLEGDLSALTISSELTGLYSASLNGSASLLNEQLPFELSVLSKHLELVQDDKTIAVDDASVSAKGDLTAFDYSLNTKLSVTDMPKLAIDGEGKGNFSELNIERLGIESEKSTLTLAGKVNWQQGVDASISVLSENISTEEFLPSVASNLALKGDLAVHANGNKWQLDIPEFAVAGQINNAPIDAIVAMKVDDRLKASISKLQITSDKNQLTLHGEITKEWDISGNLNLVNPDTLDPRLSGHGNAEFKITGELEKPKARWQANLKQLAFEEYRIDALSSEGHVDVAKNYLSKIAFDAKGISLDDQPIHAVSVSIEGDLKQHLAKLSLESETVNAKSQINGGLINNQYAGSVNKLALKNQKINLTNQQAIDFSYHVNSGQVNVSEHCWQGTNTAFCLKPLTASAEQGELSLALKHFDLSVLTLALPKTIAPAGQLVGHLDARWQHGKLLSLNSEIKSSDVNFAINESFIKTQVPIEQFYLNAKADQKNVMLDANLASSVLGNIISDIDITDVTGKRALTGKIQLQALDFSNLTGFSQQIDKLDGELNADVTLSGSAFSPQVNGKLALQGLAFLAPWTPLSIEQGNMAINFNDHSANLNGELFDSNKGSLALDGQANWQGEPSVSANIKGNGFKIALEPNLWFAISPNINMTYEQQFANVSGQVRVVDGRIKVKELPEGAVSVSDDEVIVDAAKQTKKPLPIRYGIDLSVVIDDNVRIDSFGLRSKLKGDVLFKQVGDTPLIATGEVALLEGYYRGLGQELQIEKGQIAFNGAVDKPLLNVRAIRNPDLTEDGVIAGIKLTGGVEQPRLEVFSDPKMDQAMALSYLLSGRPLSDSNSSSDGMLTQLLLSRGLARGEGSITKIGEAIGIEDVSLSSRGSGEETKVEISGYVAPGIQVRYSIGIFDSMSEVAVRYQLLPKLYIEAISGLNDSLDILYKFDWD